MASGHMQTTFLCYSANLQREQMRNDVLTELYEREHRHPPASLPVSNQQKSQLFLATLGTTRPVSF